jgi:peroxiredoxin
MQTLRFVGVLLWFWAASAVPVPSAQTIEIGSKISSFEPLPTVFASQSISLSGKAVVFVFWSFKCPVSLAYSDRMNELQEKYRDKGIAVFGVASAANETGEEIRANIDNLKLQVPVLLDKEGSLAAMLGATHTPSVFVFDEGKTLRYKGALDNNKKNGESKRVAYVEDAINAILAGHPVPVPETKPFGCSIKRRGVID